MKTNHDYRLPRMKDTLRPEGIPARFSAFKELKCEAGHIVTADLRIDGLRHVMMMVYDVISDHVQINGGYRIRDDHAYLIDPIIAAFRDYVQSCRIA